MFRLSLAATQTRTDDSHDDPYECNPCGSCPSTVAEESHSPKREKARMATSGVKSVTRSRSIEPEVLRFEARLTARSAGSDPTIAFPLQIARKLADLESVEGTINDHPFRAVLDRAEAGGRDLRVNAAMLRGSAARVGDTVRLAILGPEGTLVVPADLRVAMARSGEATALWAEMSEVARRDYVRWIDATSNAATRARRVQRTVEQLAEGKRRPCCFNAYEYPLSYIDPQWLEKFRAKRTSG
jgi:hypothetical protein